jgi:ribonuclease HI
MGITGQIESIYTDGACSGNPGSGGWGVVICYGDGCVQELGGSELNTTNNRMELQAAIAALTVYAEGKQSEPCVLYTDSEYVRNGITKWIRGWKNKSWKTTAGKPVMNQDLWQTLDALNHRNVTWRYVKAHDGNPGNERADTIASGYAQGKPVPLRSDVCKDFVPSPTTISMESQASVPDLPIQAEAVDAMAAAPAAKKPAGATAAPSSLSPNLSSNLEATAASEAIDLDHRLGILRMAHEIATQGYLITTTELGALLELHPTAITQRGDSWLWRNWMVSRVRREGHHLLWQLERVD